MTPIPIRRNGVPGDGSSRCSYLENAMVPVLKPLGDRVVVERLPAPEKTAGGVVLPGTAQDKPREGTVIAAGPGRILNNGDLRPLEVHQGDRVLFGSYAGNEIQVDGKEYLILTEEEILAVLSN
jgi:chaperonin GroES